MKSVVVGGVFAGLLFAEGLCCAWGASLVTGAPAQYIIISPSAWTTSLTYYASVKTAAGITTRVEDVESILLNYAGTDSTERVLNYLKDAHAQWPLDYLLLVGEIDFVPSGPPSPAIEHDLYFSKLDGPGDLLIDVEVGRLLATNAAEVLTISTRWANYNTFGWGRSELCVDGDGGVTRSSYNNFSNYGWNVRQIYGGEVFNTMTTQQFEQAMSGGHGLINQACHGAPATWRIVVDPVNGSYYWRDSDTLKMTNSTRLAFVNAIYSCNTGAFSNRYSIARSFIKAPNGGAIGYIGANTVVELPGPPDSFLDRFYENVRRQFLENGKVRPSKAFHDALDNIEQLQKQYNLVGDPTALINMYPPVADATPPTVTPLPITTNIMMPGQYVELNAQASDNDVVGIVEAVLVSPSAFTTRFDLVRNLSNNRYEGGLGATNNQPPGTYQLSVYVRDISQNTSNRFWTNFVVLADNEPPEITSASVASTNIFQNQPLALEAFATDNNAYGELQVFANLVINGGATQRIDQTDFVNFSATAQTGVYQFSFRAIDYSGNEAVPSNFTVIVQEDLQAPQILNAWVATNFSMPWSVTTAFWVEATGTMMEVSLVATDNASIPFFGTSRAEITKPDRTVVTNDLMWRGMFWPESFRTDFMDTDLPGTYTVRYFVGDYAGNVATAGPIPFYIEAPTVTTNHGVPWHWLAWHGFTPNESGDLEIGANGMAAWESYIAGLSPSNPAARFQFEDFSWSPAGGPQFTFAWDFVTNRNYALEWAAPSPDGSWSNMFSGNAFGTCTTAPPTGAATMFFRVHVSGP